jgi:hypothetical protein
MFTPSLAYFMYPPCNTALSAALCLFTVWKGASINLDLHLHRYYFAKIFFLVSIHDRSDTPHVVTATVVAVGV